MREERDVAGMQCSISVSHLLSGPCNMMVMNRLFVEVGNSVDTVILEWLCEP